MATNVDVLNAQASVHPRDVTIRVSDTLGELAAAGLHPGSEHCYREAGAAQADRQIRVDEERG